MNILEIIEKKRMGKNLTKSELDFAFNGYLKGRVENYQMSSLLMAICINGMSVEETIDLTDLMLNSGSKLDTSKINGILVDKHSTGGVGDKTTLVIGPILASLGLKMGKLSGRGLGFTGGTIDKLESIPGFRVCLSNEEFIHNINTIGFALMMQTPDLTPLDKVIYDLRNSSGTVSSIPLIASSIMSKKLAIGADYILIDLKVGDGALIKSREDAIKLADIMIKIGEKYHKTVIPVLTNMDTPLGDNVGNALEVLEAFDTLKGKNGTLRDLSIELSSVLTSASLKISLEEARKKVIEVLDNGKAYEKFLEFINAQDGLFDEIKTARIMHKVTSDKEGIIKEISASKIGYLSLMLGSGRKKMNDPIDYEVGVVLNRHVGDYVKEGDIICYIYQNDNAHYIKQAREAFTIVK